jgi:hypothetical protein
MAEAQGRGLTLNDALMQIADLNQRMTQLEARLERLSQLVEALKLAAG